MRAPICACRGLSEMRIEVCSMSSISLRWGRGERSRQGLHLRVVAHSHDPQIRPANRRMMISAIISFQKLSTRAPICCLLRAGGREATKTLDGFRISHTLKESFWDGSVKFYVRLTPRDCAKLPQELTLCTHQGCRKVLSCLLVNRTFCASKIPEPSTSARRQQTFG